MKKFLSFTLTFLILLAIFPLFTVNTYAYENYAKGFDGDTSKSELIDTSGLMDNETITEMNELIQSFAERLEMNILIFTAGSAFSAQSDYQTEIFCDDTYDEIFGEDTDGVFYYIDISGKRPAYDYISTSGKAVLMYEGYKERIFSELDNYLPPSSEPVTQEHIINAIGSFCSQLEYYYGKASTGFSEYYYDSSSGKYFYYQSDELVISTKKAPILRLGVLVISALVGFIVGIIVYFSIKSQYKFRAGQNASAYISHEESRFTVQEDRFLRTHTSRQHIESSSGGGHRSGGGGHSHSGGHGGGGHHR